MQSVKLYKVDSKKNAEDATCQDCDDDLLQPVDQSAILTNPVHLRHPIGQYGGIGQSGACLTNLTISKLWFRQLDLVMIHLVVWASVQLIRLTVAIRVTVAIAANIAASFALITGHERIRPGACWATSCQSLSASVWLMTKYGYNRRYFTDLSGVTP